MTKRILRITVEIPIKSNSTKEEIEKEVLAKINAYSHDVVDGVEIALPYEENEIHLVGHEARIVEKTIIKEEES